MVKWKSPLFSDLRNKLGDSVVFSSWKGRPYARQLVEPSNPNTEAQQAYRDSMGRVTSSWQSRQHLTDYKTGWNALAVDRQILGFNLFTRYAQASDISVEDGASSGEVDVTFDHNLPLDQAVIVYYDPSAEEWGEAANITQDEGSTTVSGIPTEEDVEFYIGTDAHEMYSESEEYGAAAHWDHDTEEGEAVPATVTVT